MDSLEFIKQKLGCPLSHLREVTHLRYVQVERSDGGTDQNIELTIRTEDEEPRTALSLRCLGVRNFHVKDFGGGRSRLIGFDLKSLKGRQLEGVGWEVLDYENDDLGFLCREIEVLSVGPIGT